MNRFGPLLLLLALSSCMKKDAQLTQQTAASVSDNALLPLKYHAISFTTDYPTLPGKVPPFSFSKTLYPDTRVSKLKMFTRATFNYGSFPQRGYEWDCNFSYSLNASHMTGTRKLYEYSIDPVTRAGVKKLISNEWLSYNFRFNSKGYCDWIRRTDLPDLQNTVLQVYYNGDTATDMIYVASGVPEIILFYINPGTPAMPTFATYTPYNVHVPIVTIKYQPVASGKTVLYQPTQYALSQEYSLLEAMQWAPSLKRERKTVSLEFWTPNGVHVTQGQGYINHKYDANGNLISYTYGDGVLQKITWK